MTQYYGQFDAEGFPIGFYVDAVHGARMRPIYVTIDDFEVDETTGEPRKVGEHQQQIGKEPNPDCKIPVAAVPITFDQWQEFVGNDGRRRWQNGALVTLEPPPIVPTQADYAAAIQALLDAKARERQYDGIHTAIGYRDDPNPTFAAEANALFVWRSAVWTYSSAELTKVLAGERQRPSVEELVAELPAFQWPAMTG